MQIVIIERILKLSGSLLMGQLIFAKNRIETLTDDSGNSVLAIQVRSKF